MFQFKHIFVALLFFSSGSSFGQLVNGDFEDWYWHNGVNPVTHPVDWVHMKGPGETIDSIMDFDGYCAKIFTIDRGPGLGITPGFVGQTQWISENPAFLNFTYKFIPGRSFDHGLVYASVEIRDSLTDTSGIEVGKIQYILDEEVNQWTSTSLPFDYSGNEGLIGNTITVYFLNSFDNTLSQLDTELWLDNVSLEGIVGVETVLKPTEKQPDKVFIYDATGRLVKENEISKLNSNTNLTTNLPLGIYFLQYFVEEKFLYTKKVFIKK